MTATPKLKPNVLNGSKHGMNRKRQVSLFAASLQMLLVALSFAVCAWFLIGFSLNGFWTWGLDPGDTTRVDAVQVVLTMTAGVGGIVALTIAYRRQQVNEEGRFMTSLENAARQLGALEPTVQFAGIYALAALADESGDTRKQKCVDVLCGYLRLPYSGSREASMVREVVERHAWSDGRRSVEETRTHQLRPADREVRLTIIREISERLQPDVSNSWSGLDLDFTGAVFDGGDFGGAKFSGGTVKFSGAKFSGGTVNFSGVQFSGGRVDFTGAQFSGGRVDFTGAQFSGGTVNFTWAKFSGGRVDFARTLVSGGTVNFTWAKFSDRTVNFTGALVSGGIVDFALTSFTGGIVDFTEALFSGGKVNFDRAKFSGGTIKFRGAEYSGGTVDFSAAEFSGGTVDFDGAIFSGATVGFSGTDFFGGIVRFIRAKFTGGTMDFSTANFSNGTVDFTWAEFCGGTVGFSEVQFSGGTVGFDGAQFSGGTVDFRNPGSWDVPPTVPWDAKEPPSGVLPSEWPPELVSFD